jgi:hypothetical protein
MMRPGTAGSTTADAHIQIANRSSLLCRPAIGATHGDRGRSWDHPRQPHRPPAQAGPKARHPPVEFSRLDDAHRLGLLRTVSPIYQFLHDELQDHLAPTYHQPQDRSRGLTRPSQALMAAGIQTPQATLTGGRRVFSLIADATCILWRRRQRAGPPPPQVQDGDQWQRHEYGFQ